MRNGGATSAKLVESRVLKEAKLVEEGSYKEVHLIEFEEECVEEADEAELLVLR